MNAVKGWEEKYAIGDHIMQRWAERVRGEKMSSKLMKQYIRENEASLKQDIYAAFDVSTYLFQKPYALFGRDTQRGYYLNDRLLIITDETLKKLVTVFPVASGLPEPEASELVDMLVKQIIRIRVELDQRRKFRRERKELWSELKELEQQRELINRRIAELQKDISQNSNSKISGLEYRLHVIGGVLIDGKLLKADGGILK